jgi:galactose mutarotase-like enzyme
MLSVLHYSNRIHEVEETKDTEIHHLKDQSDKLQLEITQCNQVRAYRLQLEITYRVRADNYSWKLDIW